jgi:phosphatidylserine/phosphatidylglycerophosphate/cardiolipin synthase-like enzyme
VYQSPEEKVVDKETVITGSFSFTRAAAEKNAENLLIIKSKELAAIYIGDGNKHREHPQRSEPRYWGSEGCK